MKKKVEERAIMKLRNKKTGEEYDYNYLMWVADVPNLLLGGDYEITK